MNREDAEDPGPQVAHGINDEPWSAEIDRPEKAGQYCFPPIGVVSTAGARLIH